MQIYLALACQLFIIITNFFKSCKSKLSTGYTQVYIVSGTRGRIRMKNKCEG